MSTRVGRVVRLLATTTGVLTVALGVAVATGAIPDGGGVVHGCYQKNKGSLRVIDTGTGETCLSSEKPLDWNQTGPQGPLGPQGPTGKDGPAGPQGGSAQLFEGNAGDVIASDSGTYTVAQLNVPAGSYFVTAKSTLHTSFESDGHVYCRLHFGGKSGQVMDESDVALMGAAESGGTNADEEMMNLQSAVITDHPALLEVDCDFTSGEQGAKYNRIDALQISG